MGVIEGGTAVLFAIVIYAIFYGLAGTQVRKLLIADEEPVVRILGFFGIAFVALMVWAIATILSTVDEPFQQLARYAPWLLAAPLVVTAHRLVRLCRFLKERQS